jgi:drug/metabolite transporter (DMT)-like permease
MAGEFFTVFFGLASALSWGAGDFCGGLTARRAPVLSVLVVAQGSGLLMMAALALLWREPLSASADLWWGAAGGLFGTIGLGALYRGLAVGRVGVVAPVSAVITATLPAAYGILTEGWPGSMQVLGFGLALLGVWLVSASAESQGTTSSGLGLAVVAGLGFGLFYIFLSQASASATFWPLAAARATSLPFVFAAALYRRQLHGLDLKLLPLVILTGLLDTGGNALFVLARQAGRLDVAAILSSLYPASTILLSRLILKERLSSQQGLGVLATLVAIALIAA